MFAIHIPFTVRNSFMHFVLFTIELSFSSAFVGALRIFPNIKIDMPVLDYGLSSVSLDKHKFLNMML